ncbi:MAG: hypothetical protein ACTH5M_09155 [Psychrobacter sp.]|uniref:hypothetical protein n=1 Tax=Psychrobacter sp. AOP7-B1-24 TaxID=3457645 RepID=UPI003FB936AD
MFTDFDDYLSSSFSDDYWSDEGISIAEAMLCKFSDEDWLIIKEQLKHRNYPWLERCANVLGDFNDSKSMKLLIKFLDIDDVEVQIAALDSINSLLSMAVITKDTNNDLIGKINKVQSSNTVIKIMLDSLKKRVGCG